MRLIRQRDLQPQSKMNNRVAIEYYNTGLQYAKQKKWNEAIEVLNKAIAEDPKHVNSYNVLGKVYLQRGEIDVARKYWSIALKIDPDNVTAKQCLAAAGTSPARIQFKALFWPAAVVILLATLIATNSILLHQIGSLKDRLRKARTGQVAGGMPALSGPAVQENQQTQPKLVEAATKREDRQTLSSKPTEEDSTPRPSITRPPVQTVQVSPPKTASEVTKVYERARADCESGQYNQAIETFQQILKYPQHHPLKDNAQYWLAECYYAQKKYNQALVEFQKVKENFPKASKMFDAELKVAYTYYNLDRIREAEQKLSQLSKNYPQYQSSIEILSRKIELRRKK